MTTMKTAAFAAAAALLLVACQPSGQMSAAEMDAVKAVNGAWAEHYNAGDAAAVAGLYWDDASLMAPGAPAVTGGDAIRDYFVADVEGAKAAGLSMSMEHGPVSAAGATAWQEGRFKAIDASGATVDAGKYLSVLEKHDGQWKLSRDIWNSDGKPAAAPGAPDSVTTDPAHYKVEFENDRVRVLRIAYGPKEKSVMHSHPDSVAVYLSEVDSQFTLPDGSTMGSKRSAGQFDWAPAGDHLPENLGSKPFELILVELK